MDAGEVRALVHLLRERTGMTGTVWCVFQRLPGDSCPSLAAVCRTRAVAEAAAESGRREARESGEPEGEWTIGEWTVLDAKAERQAERAQRISHVLDPIRQAETASEEEREARDEAAGR